MERAEAMLQFAFLRGMRRTSFKAMMRRAKLESPLSLPPFRILARAGPHIRYVAQWKGGKGERRGGG